MEGLEKVTQFLKESYIFRPERVRMYAADDGNTQVLYFQNATATISAFTHEPEIIRF